MAVALTATDHLPATAIPLPLERIAQFCHRWNVSEFSLFGSILRADFRAESDVDVMVSFLATANPTLYTLVDMKEELENLFGRKVDLLTRRGVESMPNWYRRRAILDSVKVIYAA